MLEKLSCDLLNMEDLLYEFGALDRYEDDDDYINEQVAEFTELYKKDINGFLKEFYNRTEMFAHNMIDANTIMEFKLGKVLECLAYWGSDFNSIDTGILKKYTSHLLIDDCSVGDCNWEAGIERRYELSDVDEYMHFNFFDLLYDYNTISEGIDEDKLVEILSNLKEKGYMMVLVSDKKIPQAIKNSVSGAIENSEVYASVRREL